MWMVRLLLLLSLSHIAQLNAKEEKSSPPKAPPADMIDGFTMDGQVPIEDFYVDDTNGGEGSHYGYTSDEISKYIAGAKKLSGNIYRAIRDIEGKRKSPQLLLGQLKKEDWLYFALYNYTDIIMNSKCAVFGSTSPWVESICLALGADSVTTIEYNTLTYGDPETNQASPTIRTISGPQFNSFYSSSGGTYDLAISMSSFDHDGLGRYGDPLDPDGDMKAMERVAMILKPGGLLFLTVPVGPDVVVFNLHRRYGKVRLLRLLQGWEVVDRVGWVEDRVDAPANWRQTYEPVFVLRKPLEVNEL